jgi:hypothetical protein
VSEQARAWLAMRAGAVPGALQTRMESAIAGLDGDNVAAVLAEAAHACLGDALAAGDERGAALHLLAADALITYACEAAADADGSALAGLAADNAPQRLSHLIGDPGAS